MHETLEQLQERIEELKDRLNASADKIEAFVVGTGHDDVISSIDSATSDLANAYSTAEKTPSPDDDRLIGKLEKTIKKAIENQDPSIIPPEMSVYFTAYVAFLRAENSIMDKRSEVQTRIVQSALDAMLQAKNSIGWAELDEHFENLVRRARGNLIYNWNNKGLKRWWDEEKSSNTFRDLSELVSLVSWHKLKDPYGENLNIVQHRQFIAQAAAQVDRSGSRNGERSLDKEGLEKLKLILSQLDNEIFSQKTRPEVERELKFIEEVIYRILHENRVILANARGLNNEQRKYLRPSTKYINEDVYGEMMMFMGELYGEIDEAESIGLVVALAGEKKGSLSQEDVEKLKKLREKIYRNKMRYVNLRTNAQDILDTSDIEYIKKFTAEVDLYLKWLDFLINEVGGSSQNKILNSEATLAELDASDIEKLASDQLYRYGKMKLNEVTAGLTPYTADAKHEVNKRFNQIIDELRSREDLWPRRAQYLFDLREFTAADGYSTTSAFTMNYDALLEGNKENNWFGANTPSQFNEKHVFRLLYGADFARVEGSRDYFKNLDSEDSEERERIRSVNVLLQICCELYDDASFDSAQNKIVMGEFHATQHFSRDLKEKFLVAVEDIWKTQVLGLQLNDELSQEQREAFDLAMMMQEFLDLRTYYAMPFYIAGWSPEDDIGKTIGTTAGRFENAKGMYIICGKGKFFVNPGLNVSRFSEDVEDALKGDGSTTKRNNYRFSTQVATPTWSSWWGPRLDDQEGLSDDELLSFRRKRGEMMVPALYGAFWLPHKRGQTQDQSLINSNTRDGMLASSGKENAKSGYKINLRGLLTGAQAAEKYVTLCEAGFKPSDDMEADVERIKHETEAMAEALSPTKSLFSINRRYLANNMYQYARLSIISFSEKHRPPEDDEEGTIEFFRYLARFINNIRSTILSAPTAEIKIPKYQIPELFRKKYGLPDEEITITDYVLGLLPSVDERNIGGAMFFIEDSKARGIDEEVEKWMIDAASYHPRRKENNKDLIEHKRGETHGIMGDIKNKVAGMLRAGGFAPPLKENFVIQAGGSERRTERDFWNAMVVIPISKEEKQAKD